MELFVYGTLTDPDRVDGLLGEYALLGEATLRGLRVVEGRYPTLAPSGRTVGRLLRTPEVDRLDAYEGVDRGLYVRVAVPADRPRADAGGEPDAGAVSDADGEGDAVGMYVGRPDRLGLGDRIDWPGDGPFRERVERYLADRDVRVVAPDDAGAADAP